jgi:hypothetical protein
MDVPSRCAIVKLMEKADMQAQGSGNDRWQEQRQSPKNTHNRSGSTIANI